MTDREFQEVAERLFGERTRTQVATGYAKRFSWRPHRVEYRPAYFAESIKNCRDHMIPFLEKHELRGPFINHLLRSSVTAGPREWGLVAAGPIQWCEAFLAATEHLAEKQKAKKG